MPEKNTQITLPNYEKLNECDFYSSRGHSTHIGKTFLGITPTTSVKSDYNRGDYNYFHNNGGECEDKIVMSMLAYERVGIVRNIIDLMSDFTCKGIKLIHQNARHEKFYREWWEAVDGALVSERFLNYLYRIANVPVQRFMGKLPVKIEKKWMSANSEVETIREEKVEYRQIPMRYNFICPTSLKPLVPELSIFTGKPIYGLILSRAVATAISRLQAEFKNVDYQDLLKLIPDNILLALKNNKMIVPLDSTNIDIYFYKKDDWDIWAKPMISSIFDDLKMLEKLKLADMSALDGAISNVRLWNLGRLTDDLRNSLMPDAGAILKVRNILAQGISGGTLDLVWGPELDFKESDTKVHQFLGPAKYEPVLRSIYEGLGVPFGAGDAKGLTNNFIAMQTFVERLEYGRKVLVDFWNKELKMVQKALGHTKAAVVTFDQINLGDDTNYKKLLIDLYDRDVIGIDTLSESFNIFSPVEKRRLKKDATSRKSGKLSPKAGAFHNPQTHDEMKKIMLQNGGVAPSEVGMELQDKKPGEKSVIEQTNENDLKIAKQNKKAQIAQQKFAPKKSLNGRPKKSGDKTKRKQKVITQKKSKASEFVNLFVWANSAQREISDIVTPIALEKYGKKNVRSLSSKEFEDLEGAKFIFMSRLQPYEPVTAALIENISLTPYENESVSYAAKALKSTFMKRNKREPTVEEMRQIQASAYALCFEPEQDEDKLQYELNVPL